MGAKSFVLMSNMNGIYLGDKILDQIFDKLSQRKTTLLIHPTLSHVLSQGGQSASTVQTIAPLPQFPRPMIEIMFCETRAIINLLASGTVAWCYGITFIMSRCGCALAPILERAAAFTTVFSGQNKGRKFRRLLRTRFYFDLAGIPFPERIYGLLSVSNGQNRYII
jgi:6-methylsalicylate decarboxylase